MSNEVEVNKSRVKFVFSTRYFDDLSKNENGKAFSAPQPLGKESPLYKFLFAHFWEDGDNVWECFKKYRRIEELKLKFDNEFSKPSIASISSSGVLKIFLSKDAEKRKKFLIDDFFQYNIVHDEKHIESCQKDSNGKQLKSRFSYYKLKADPDCRVYAVPHLNWKPDKRWVEALIEERFDQPDNEKKEDELYLVLHDNDVPGFASTPYKYLTAQEIYKLLKGKVYKKEDDNDVNNQRIREENDDWAYYLEDGRKLVVIVFQHTWNDVVYLLKKSDTKYDEIKARLMTGNKKSIRDFFKSDLSSSVAKPDFSGLNPEYSVDVCQNRLNVEGEKIEDKKLVFSGELNLPLHKDDEPEYKKIRIYTDNNGALLTALMHVGTNSNSAEMLKDFIKLLRKPGHLDDKTNDDKTSENETVDLKKICFPLIIRIYKSFFDDWAEAVPANKNSILGHRNKKALDENLERVFSFFNNSSIWIRLVDMYDEDAYNRAVAEFNYFDSIGLYDYNSAWENLEYNLRFFKVNYLESTLDGHGNFVTPMVYGNEVTALKALTDNSVEINKHLDTTPQNDSGNKKEERDHDLWKHLEVLLKDTFVCFSARIKNLPQRTKRLCHRIWNYIISKINSIDDWIVEKDEKIKSCSTKHKTESDGK